MSEIKMIPIGELMHHPENPRLAGTHPVFQESAEGTP